MNLDEELEAYYKKQRVGETVPMLANIIIGIMERDSISFDGAFSLGFDEEYRDLIKSEVECLKMTSNKNRRQSPGMGTKKALITASRKMLSVIHAMLKSGSDFSLAA